jgi:UDP-glucose 4-epimerase
VTQPILITGGAGYIGSHVAWQCVERGYDVTVIDNLSAGSVENVPPAASFREIDLGDRQRVDALLMQLRPAAVLHFAASVSVPESVEAPLKFYRNNVINSIGLIESCVRAEVPSFIFSSTSAVYEPSASVMVDETSPVVPSSPYGRSKLMVEWVLRDATTRSPMRAGILRYFNVAGVDLQNRCGPRTLANKSLIRIAARVAVGDIEYLPLYGTDYDTPDGTCIRDYIHVLDLSDAHLAVLDLIAREGVSVTLNRGYGTGHSVLDIIASFERVLERPLPVKHMPRRQGDMVAVIADPTQLRSRTGWQPRFADIDSMVASSIAWERFLRDQTMNEPKQSVEFSA